MHVQRKGKAHFMPTSFEGKKTANGEFLAMSLLTAAHRSFEFWDMVK